MSVTHQGTAVREIEVEGHRITLADEVRVGGESVGFCVDPTDGSAVIAGHTATEMVVNACRAGMELARTPVVAIIDNNIRLVPSEVCWPHVPRFGQPDDEEERRPCP